MTRHPQLLDSRNAGLLIVDIQEKLIGKMASPRLVLENTIRLIRAFRELKRPVMLTEQYPRGLGHTVPEIHQWVTDIPVQEKLDFSCCGMDGFTASLRAQKITQVVVCGIETHVCIWQTAMDLQHHGFMSMVIGDAVSSRTADNHQNALNRMMQHSIEVASTEMALFEMLRRAGTDAFRMIHQLIV